MTSTVEQPGLGRMLWRGATRRCPYCGSGHLFRWWVEMVDDCPRCGLHFERIEGHWIGAIGMNTIISFGILLIATVIGVIVFLPDIPVVPLVLVNVAIALFVPILIHPISRTFWTAVDLGMTPAKPEDFPAPDPAPSTPAAGSSSTNGSSSANGSSANGSSPADPAGSDPPGTPPSATPPSDTDPPGDRP
ncbi:MAG: DUF983 domain-containing protein [Acidimicrobiales bacterium]